MVHLGPVLRVARELLILRDDRTQADPWLWDHTVRVTRLARLLARLPEAGPEHADETVLTVAALFHNAGWAMQVREKQIERHQVLNRPTNDLLRELGAAALQERAANLMPDELLEMAADAIRQCNDRYSTLPAARVLADATNLEEIGLTYVLRQLRHGLAEGRPLEQLLAGWKRQVEYRFWDARIGECLQMETARRIARRRLEAVEQFMHALERDGTASDLRAVLAEQNIPEPDEIFTSY